MNDYISTKKLWKLGLAFSLILGSQFAWSQVKTLDDFNNTNGWNYIKSEGGDVKMNISNDNGRTGKAIRLDDWNSKGHPNGYYLFVYPGNNQKLHVIKWLHTAQ